MFILLLYLKDTFISCNRPFFKIAKITSVKIASSLQLSPGLFEVNGDLNSLLLDCGFIIYIFCHKILHAVLPKWKGKITVGLGFVENNGTIHTLTFLRSYTNLYDSWKILSNVHTFAMFKNSWLVEYMHLPLYSSCGIAISHIRCFFPNSSLKFIIKSSK